MRLPTFIETFLSRTQVKMELSVNVNRKLVIVFRIKWWEMDFGLVWLLDLVIAWSELVISCLEISVSGFEIKMNVMASYVV